MVWLPARSRLRLSHPVSLPGTGAPKEGIAEVHSLLVERTPGQELLLKDESGQLRHDRSLVESSAERHMGLIVGCESGESVPQDVLDLVIAGRVSQGLNNRVTVSAGQFLPVDQISLNYLDRQPSCFNRTTFDF